MNRKMLAPLAFAAILSAGAAGSAVIAHAGEAEGSDAAALANAKITLGQAIAAAEQRVGGKAIDAGVENQNGTVSIAVDVAGKQGVKTVLFDPATGQITATRPANNADNGERD